MRSLQRISAAIDRLNDRIGSAIQWLALVMVIIGAFNAIARYAGRYTGVSLSSNFIVSVPGAKLASMTVWISALNRRTG